MTVYYVDSAAGSNTSPYDTWAKAATSLATIAGIDAAGDTIYVASTHSETTAGPVSLNWAGTLTNPVEIICADKTSGAPPSTAATGAAVANTGANFMNVVNSGVASFYGVYFTCGSGTSASNMGMVAAGYGYFSKCRFVMGGTGASQARLVNGSGASAVLDNCDFSFGATTQSIGLQPSGYARLRGGSILSGSSAITTLVGVAAGSANAEFQGFDFSNAAASVNLVNASANAVYVVFADCKAPTSWSGSANGSTPGNGSRVVANLVDSSGTNYALAIGDMSGTIAHETTIVLSGGATDGTTPISWNMGSGTQCVWPALALRSEWRAVWVDTTTSKTLTWQYVADSAVAAGQGAGTGHAFQNNQVWIEAIYLGASASPLGTLASSSPATPVTTATDNAAGSGTWTTTGLTTPKQGECTLTFTTAMKGPMLSRICVGAASKTIYADPDPVFA